ncbi:FAD-dependent oxidoreductase [Streptomyces sp. NA04227]|uniref:FAD-dependent oxidoreductase n=1 Tax=Streptomyces sp. NA04227 TaxID=2742136 RepID=UPI001C3782E9|nr:FAD-dependent oxidoreductase [Streptomyces sp. NA04227]
MGRVHGARGVLTGHDWTADPYARGTWTADPYARGTWAVFRPGQLAASWADFQVPEGRVHFAGGDFATGYPGTIDGAIEGGLTAARKVLAALGSAVR